MLELIELGHGLLRELPDCRLWGVDDGALMLGEDATQFVFCWQGALTMRQAGGGSFSTSWKPGAG